MIESLKGYKSYIVAALIGIVSAVHYLGYIYAESYTAILGLLCSSGIAALRALISKKLYTKIY